MRFKWTPVLILFSMAGILGFFQNCTPAVPFGNTDYYQSLVNSSEFAYEVGVDQLAYMSCSEQEDIPNDGTFFTFRVGAFDSQGIRVTQAYRDSITKVRNGDVPYAMSQANASAGTTLQFAVRTLDNLQLMYVDNDNGEDGENGSDYNNFFPLMGNETFNEILWNMQPGDYMRTFAGANFISQYRFEGELKFMKSQIMENDLRAFFGNRGILAVTWANQAENTPLGPGSFINLQELEQGGGSGGVNGASVQGANVNAASNDLASNVFGAAIQPRFKQALFQGGSPGADMPPRVLSTVDDIVIDSRKRGQLNRPWTCPDSMQFMIVLPEHAIYQDANSNTIVRCAMDPDPINPSPELQIIRQSLYAEDFYVDMVRKCIVPKPDHTVQGSCYGMNSNTNLTQDINYDSFNTNGCGFGNLNGLCPHYASVCFRQ